MIALVLCLGLSIGVASQDAFLSPTKQNITAATIASSINDLPNITSATIASSINDLPNITSATIASSINDLPTQPVRGHGFNCSTTCNEAFAQVCMDAETKCDKESEMLKYGTDLFTHQVKLVCLLDEFNRSQVAVDDCAKCKECAKSGSGSIGWREHGVATCTYDVLTDCDGLNRNRCFEADYNCAHMPENDKPSCLKGFLGNEKSFHLCENCALCQSQLEDKWNSFHCATTCQNSFTQVCEDAEMKCDTESGMLQNGTASRGPTDLFLRQDKLVCLLDEFNRSQVAVDDCAKCKECAKSGSGGIGWKEHGVATCTFEVLTDCDGLNRTRCFDADYNCAHMPENEKPSCLKHFLGNEKSFHLCENCALCQSQFEDKWGSII